MYMPTEWLLAGALVAIYLFDSAYFLRIGEAVAVTRRGSVLRLALGSSFEVGGRRPYLPNPFTPGSPALRIDWDMSGHSGANPDAVSAEMTARVRLTAPIGWLSTVCAFLMALVAPLALVAGQQQLFVIAAVLCLLLTAAASILLLRRRRALGLSVWQAVSLIVIAIVCLPCAGNLARAVAAQRIWTLPAAQLPRLAQGAAARRVTETTLRDLLARTQRLLPDESTEYRTVSEQLKLLEAAVSEHK
jgi:hypothetical protein